MTVHKPRAPSRLKPGQVVERGIQYRGPNQYRAFIRERGVDLSETFPTVQEAQKWRTVKRGEVFGETHVDKTLADRTKLSDACAWLFAELEKTKGTALEKPNDKNLRVKLKWWQESKFAHWKLSRINAKALRRWVREVLIADVGDDEVDRADAEQEVAKMEGGGKPPSVQTVVHRLNALSRMFRDWSIANELDEVDLPNPCNVRGVRPPLTYVKRRRLKPGEEDALLEPAARVRPWLRQAIILALETTARQTELATLQWDNVHLHVSDPKMDVVNSARDGQRTKNTLDRTIPLSDRAITAFVELKEMADAHNARRLARIEAATTQKQRAAAIASPTWDKPIPVDTGRGIIHAWTDLMDEVNSAPTAKLIENLTWHCLRHEAISRLFEGDGNMTDTEIMAIAGHLTKDMLERYTHLRAAKLGHKLPSNGGGMAESAGTVRLRPDGTFRVKDQKGRWVSLPDADRISKVVAIELLRAALATLEEAGKT